MSNDKLHIGFKCRGGLGDILIALNYIHAIRESITSPNISIDIYAHTNLDMVKSLLPCESNFVDHVFLDKDIADNGNDKYDLFVYLNRFPDVRRRSMDKIYKFAPNLIEFVQACERYRIFNRRFYDSHICDGLANDVSEILGKKRIQQPDIYELFGITEKFGYELSLRIGKERTDYFEGLGLESKKYITIHRGTDTRQVKNSVKLWPFEFYQTLINYIKSNFPQVLIVQLGVSQDRCPSFDCVDVNLVGKTTNEDMKFLLKNSYLHIDNEGGNVHLRHALNGGSSVVLFGPTSPAFYGYDENLNLRGKGCPIPCEWILNEWQGKCPKGKHYTKLPCMLSMTPEMVFREIEPILKQI